jgi:glycosyltransferase involved in cell wall biosynthesis
MKKGSERTRLRTQTLLLQEYHPLITIIVAVLNRRTTVKRCLESIEVQDYPNKELIVMDGGSTDGSLLVLEKHKNLVAYSESAPDRGIYHAWNKALMHAHGEWICFLGADDFFWTARSLTEMEPYLIEAAEDGIRVVYGQVVKINWGGSILRVEGKPWEKIRWLMPHGMPLPHPGLMHHRSLFDVHGHFDETFRIAGDYDLLLRELRKGQALHAPGVRVVGSEIGGIADSLKLLSHQEVSRARQKNGLPAWTWLSLAIYGRSLIRLQWRKLRTN